MVALTALQWVQLIAGATIPVIFICILASRLNIRKAFRWRQTYMAIVVSLVPALILLGVRGIITGWAALAGIAFVAILALIGKLQRG